jgi:hypothetical protein
VVFQPGWSLYHAGLVDGVMVADPAKFGGAYHREGLVGWLPFNEHPADELTVTDRARSQATSQLLGAQGPDRQWDDTFGYVLYMRPGATLQVFADREMTTQGMVSCWVRADALTALGALDEVILQQGPLRLTLNRGLNNIKAWVLDAGAWTDIATYAITPYQWKMVGVGYTTTAWLTLEGDLASVSPGALGGGGALSTVDDKVLAVTGHSRGYQIHDLRVWNQSKSFAELELVHNYQPRATQTLYSVSHIKAANDADQFALRVLPMGWLAPGSLPAWVRMPKYARVIRYGDMGEYEGEARFKEVGLGGGQMPPYAWYLGTQGPPLTGAGTLVVSTQIGAYPGTNAYWGKDTSPGSYIVLSGSNSTGSVAVATLYGSGSDPWPHHVEATNPVVDTIWLPDQVGHVYKVQLQAGSDYSASFVATPGTFGNQEETGAHAGLSGTTAGNYLVVTGYGSVVQQTYAGTVTTPSLYMYLNDVLVEDVGGAEAYARWTDPNVEGEALGYPTRDTSGELAFTNSTTLLAGAYRLKITSGNLGKVDDSFDGYRVLITVGDVTIDRTLLQGFSGNNFTGTDEFEFALDHDIVGEWLLELDWTNAYEDETRGTIRQLVIYGYQLRRLETNVYKIDVDAVGTEPTLARLPIYGQAGTGSTPGGWLAQYDSFGTITRWQHEGTNYPANDTVTSKYPLSNLLTGVTENKREDVLVKVYGTLNWFVLPTTPLTPLSGTATVVVP